MAISSVFIIYKRFSNCSWGKSPFSTTVKNFRVECKGKYQHCLFNIGFFPHLCVYRWLIRYNFLYWFVEHILLLVISCIDWNFLDNKPCSQAIFVVNDRANYYLEKYFAICRTKEIWYHRKLTL